MGDLRETIERKIRWREQELYLLRNSGIQVRETMEAIRVHEACLRDLRDLLPAPALTDSQPGTGHSN